MKVNYGTEDLSKGKRYYNKMVIKARLARGYCEFSLILVFLIT